MNYRFTLKDNSERAYRLFNWFLFFLQVVAAGTVGLRAADKDVKLGIYILLAFYAAVCLVYLLVRKRKKSFETFSLIMALLYADFWLKHVGVLALFIFVAVFLFVQAVQKKKTYLLFSERGAELTRVFKTVLFPWSLLENAILKDGLLTVNFKSNKLMQAEIVEGPDAVDEKEFNSFCSEQFQNIA